ncbi:MAG: hypothetical protein K0U24_04855 [Gammaproteobacteria bacterium]|nr:hypothetical protein [Gammaproteobacteria bacterium]
MGGSPDAEQWHCAAILNVAQNLGESVGAALGQDAINTDEKNKPTDKNKILCIILNNP